MSNNENTPSTAVAKVLAIPELLESILLGIVRYDVVNEPSEAYLPADRKSHAQQIKALFRLQQVSKTFQAALKRSRACRRAMYLVPEAHSSGSGTEDRALPRFNPLIFDILNAEKSSREVSVYDTGLICNIGVSDIGENHFLHVRLLRYSQVDLSRIEPVKMPGEPVDGLESWKRTLIFNGAVTVEVIRVMRHPREMLGGGPRKYYQVSTLGGLRQVIVDEARTVSGTMEAAVRRRRMGLSGWNMR